MKNCLFSILIFIMLMFAFLRSSSVHATVFCHSLVEMIQDAVSKNKLYSLQKIEIPVELWQLTRDVVSENTPRNHRRLAAEMERYLEREGVRARIEKRTRESSVYYLVFVEPDQPANVLKEGAKYRWLLKTAKKFQSEGRIQIAFSTETLITEAIYFDLVDNLMLLPFSELSGKAERQHTLHEVRHVLSYISSMKEVAQYRLQKAIPGGVGTLVKIPYRGKIHRLVVKEYLKDGRVLFVDPFIGFNIIVETLPPEKWMNAEAFLPDIRVKGAEFKFPEVSRVYRNHSIDEISSYTGDVRYLASEIKHLTPENLVLLSDSRRKNLLVTIYRFYEKAFILNQLLAVDIALLRRIALGLERGETEIQENILTERDRVPRRNRLIQISDTERIHFIADQLNFRMMKRGGSFQVDYSMNSVIVGVMLRDMSRQLDARKDWLAETVSRVERLLKDIPGKNRSIRQLDESGHIYREQLKKYRDNF